MKKTNFWNALYTKLGLDRLNYLLPVHAQSLPFMLGGLIFTTFVILFASGMYMAQFYNPNQLSSYQSVIYLITSAPFGNFIRSVHYWSSNAVFVLLIAHMTRVFITGSYKRPREFTWLMGLGLFVLSVLFLFAGTILALGQEGIEALEHSSEIGVILGPLGLWFTSGFSASLPLIGRIYVEHMVILPLLFVVIVSIHFYLIHVHNLSPKVDKDAEVGYANNEDTVPFMDHVKRLAGWSFILIAIIGALALFFPEALGHAGAAGVPLHEVKPRWMFLWLFGMEDVLGIKALVWAPFILLTLLAIIPFIDRSKYLSWRKRPWIMAYAGVITFVIIVFSLQAMFASTVMKRPSTAMRLPFIEQILPGNIAYAHDLVFLSFTPTTVSPGSSVSLKGDGLHKSGVYNIYLDGPQTKTIIGSATVPVGSDGFTIKMLIPASISGDMYTIEAQNVAQHVTYYAPLQLAVEPVSMPVQARYPNATKRPIPRSEVPWIVGTVVISFGIGVFLLLTKDRRSTQRIPLR